MISPKEHIQCLYETNATNQHPHSNALANALEKDIYTQHKGDHKFAFELLQNADDSASTNKKISITFTLLENYLIVSHSGAVFSESDVEKICSYAQQIAVDKTANIEKTGYKGIGFKAVFSIADVVYIFSEGYQFRFDKNHPQWKTAAPGKPYPWPIIPVWSETSELPKNIQGLLESGHVNFVLKFSDNPLTVRSIQEGVAKNLEYLAENPTIGLFLRHIETIKIRGIGVSPPEASRVITSKHHHKTRDSHMDLWRPGVTTEISLKRTECEISIAINEAPHSLWLVFRYHLDVPETVRAQISDLSNHECPPKIKQATKVNLQYALQLNPKDRTALVSQQPLFCYLPTKVKLQLPMIANSDFLLNADRTGLLENPWNAFLLKQVLFTYIDVLAKLGDNPQYRNDVLKLLPKTNPEDHHADMFKSAYRQGFDEGLEYFPFIPGANSAKLLTIKQVSVDEIRFFEAFPEIKEPNFERSLFIHESVQGRERLKEFKRPFFNMALLEKEIEDYAKVDTSIDFNKRLILFIADQINQNKTARSSHRIHYFDEYYSSGCYSEGNLVKKRFVLNHTETLSAPGQLFFQGNLPSSLPINTVRFVHPELAKDEIIAKFLEEHLGTKKVTAKDIIDSEIIPTLKTTKSTEEALSLLQYIFKVHQENALPYEIMDKLCDCMLVTKNNTLRRASQCTLSNYYLQDDVFEGELPMDPDCLVNSTYTRESDDTPKWKDFFIALQVKQGMSIEVIHSLSVNEAITLKGRLMDDYVSKVSTRVNKRSQIGSDRLSNIIDIELISYTKNNPRLANKLLDLIVSNWGETRGTDYICGTQPKAVITFLQYRIMQDFYYPAQDGSLYKSTDLLSPSFSKLVGKNSSIKIALSKKELSPDQAQFFGFRQILTIKECLQLMDEASLEERSICIERHAAIINYIVNTILKKGVTRNQENREKERQEFISKEELRLWNGKMVTSTNGLKPVKELNFIKNTLQETLSNDVLIKPLTDITSDAKLNDMIFIEFCALTGVTILNDLSDFLFYTDEHEDIELKAHFQKILAAIISIQSQKGALSKEQSQEHYLKLLSTFEPIKLIKTKRLYLKISQEKILISAFRNNDIIYYREKWNKPGVKQKFISEIGSYFNIDLIKYNDLFDCSSEDEMLEYLSEKHVSDLYKELTGFLNDVDFKKMVVAAKGTDETQNARKEKAREIIDVGGDSSTKQSINRAGSVNKYPNKPGKTGLVDIEKIDFTKTTICSDKNTNTGFTNTNHNTDSSFFTQNPRKYKVWTTLDELETNANRTERKPKTIEITTHTIEKLEEMDSDEEKDPHTAQVSDNIDTAAIGDWGEEYVYEALKNKYLKKEKYKDHAYEETEEGFHLKKDGQTLSVFWRNKPMIKSQSNQRNNASVDIEIIKPSGRHYFAEVKTTTSRKPDNVELSKSESALLFSKKKDYRIYRVLEAGEESAVIKKIGNPGEKIINGQLRIKITMKI